MAILRFLLMQPSSKHNPFQINHYSLPVLLLLLSFNLIVAIINAQEIAMCNDEWTQLRGGPGFNGVSTDDSIKPPLKLRWSYRCDSDTSGDGCCGMSTAKGRLFAKMTMTKSILALDAENGRFLWEASHRDSYPYATPSTDGDMVFDWLKLSKRSSVIAYDAATGAEVWCVQLKTSDGTIARRVGPTVSDGLIYIVDVDEAPLVLALDTKTGKEVWRYSMGTEHGDNIIAPCVVSGYVIVGTKTTFKRGDEPPPVHGRVMALDAKSGKEIWSRTDIYPSQHMVSDGTLLVVKSNIEIGMKPNDNLKMRVLEVKTGKELWSLPIKSVYAAETIMADKILQKHYGSPLIAFDRKDGRKLWELRIPTGSGCGSPTISGDYAYMGTGSFNDSEGFWAWRFMEPPHRSKGKTGLCWTLHAIDLTTGASVWEYLTGNNVCGDPVIAYGNLYFNSRDGRIYCMSPVKEGETAIPDSPDKTPAAPVAEVKKLFEEKSKQFAPGTAWPMAGGTPQRTGIADAIITLPLMESWQFDTGGRILTAAAIAEGRVFVGALSGKIFAIDLNSGAKIWETATGGEIRCVPAIADDVVYCGSDDAIFRAMDAATGKIKWSYNCGGPIQASPAVVGGTVVFGANDGHIYMLNRHTGKKLWSFHGDYPLVQAPPVVSGEQIFAAQWVDWAYALNAYTGEEQWRTCVPITIESLYSFGDKFWLRSAYQFAEFDPMNGKRLRIGNAIYGYNGLAFTTNAFVMTGTRSAEVVKLDQPDAKFDKSPNLTDVKVLKSDRMLGWPKLGSAGTPLIMNDKIAFASMYGELVVTDFTGKVLWQFKLGSTSHASPTIANSVLVVGCDDGKLFAFKEKKD